MIDNKEKLPKKEIKSKRLFAAIAQNFSIETAQEFFKKFKYKKNLHFIGSTS